MKLSDNKVKTFFNKNIFPKKILNKIYGLYGKVRVGTASSPQKWIF